jgi:phosphatidylserine/phosphatidylglycerophosphate/cardiolipin synthase-like enzyme
LWRIQQQRLQHTTSLLFFVPSFEGNGRLHTRDARDALDFLSTFFQIFHDEVLFCVPTSLVVTACTVLPTCIFYDIIMAEAIEVTDIATAPVALVPVSADTVEASPLAMTAETVVDTTTTMMAAAALAPAAAAAAAMATLAAPIIYHEHKRTLSAAALDLVMENAVSLVAAQLEMELQQEQPLKKILLENPVSIARDTNHDVLAIQDTLDQLDRLIDACSQAANNYSDYSMNVGRAPGFWTMPGNISSCHLENKWLSNESMPCYQTMDCTALPSLSTKSDDGLPLPSPASAMRVYQAVKQGILERLQYSMHKQLNHGDEGDFCACISAWGPKQVAVQIIVNQVMEQLMVDEASGFLHNNENFSVQQWTANAMVPFPESTTPLAKYESPMHLLTARDHYLSILVKALMSAKSSVILSTSYVFYRDPAQLYILLDVLPYIARQHGVKVFFLMDLFVFESNMIQSPFQVKKNTSGSNKDVPHSDAELSFFKGLPKEHVPPVNALKRFESQYVVFDKLSQLSMDPESNFEMRFWCARDSQCGYRIKNHSKGVVVDDHLAIFGGSNLAPVVRSANGDLDCLVMGPAAKAVGDSFWKFWKAVDVTAQRPDASLSHLNAIEFFEQSTKANPTTFSIMQSTPCSTGEDCIYQKVLEKVETAKESITVSMGHCAFPESFSQALRRAADRGVKTIKVMVNSRHSSDLRTGQHDLFQSIRRLMLEVPTAHVFATHKDAVMNGERPDFLHAKYVIVDSQWACLGSWNLWPRSSFYEMELEALVESPEIAAQLQAKFDYDQRKNTVRACLDDCLPGNKFCPKGCLLCKGFGPFF